MTRILSQEELASFMKPTPAAGGSVGGSHAAPVVSYDFRRPDRVSKDQIRSLHFLHDRFARNAMTSLSAFLRTTTELSILSVEQFTYAEFVLAVPDPTAFYAIAMPPHESRAAAELNPSVAFAMIDRILGGTGGTSTPKRALTEIEQNVIDSVIRLLLEHLTETWRTVTDVQFQIHARETRPQMLQVASSNEIVIHLSFDMKVAQTRGLLNICVPATLIEASGTSFAQSWQQARRDATPREEQWLAENLGRARLPVTTDVQTRLKTSDLLGLAPGHVLSLGIPVGVDVNVRVGDLVKFTGRLATSAGRVAVVINQSCAGAPAAGEKVNA